MNEGTRQLHFFTLFNAKKSYNDGIKLIRENPDQSKLYFVSFSNDHIWINVLKTDYAVIQKA